MNDESDEVYAADKIPFGETPKAARMGRRLFYGSLIVLLCFAVRVFLDLLFYDGPGGPLTGG